VSSRALSCVVLEFSYYTYLPPLCIFNLEFNLLSSSTFAVILLSIPSPTMPLPRSNSRNNPVNTYSSKHWSRSVLVDSNILGMGAMEKSRRFSVPGVELV
jgi:hypothetical protein